LCKVHPETELFMSKCRAASARRMNSQVVNKLFKCEKGVPNALRLRLEFSSKKSFLPARASGSEKEMGL